MPNPNEENGTIVTVTNNGDDGTLSKDDGGGNLDFQNPVKFNLEPGKGVTFLSITHPQTGVTRGVITGER